MLSNEQDSIIGQELLKVAGERLLLILVKVNRAIQVAHEAVDRRPTDAREHNGHAEHRGAYVPLPSDGPTDFVKVEGCSLSCFPRRMRSNLTTTRTTTGQAEKRGMETLMPYSALCPTDSRSKVAEPSLSAMAAPTSRATIAL